MVCRLGLMAPATKAIGRTTRRVDRESSGTRTVTILKVRRALVTSKARGRMTRLTALESTSTLMDLCMRDIGRTIPRKAVAKRSGQTVLASRDSIAKARKTGRERTSGLTVPSTKGTGSTTICRATACTVGQMGESMQAIGTTTQCTGKESTRGKMDACMKESTRTI